MGAQSHQGCWEPAERRGGACAAAEAAEEAEAEGVEPGEIPACHLEPSVAELFEEGLRRLEHRDTWKLWRWPASDAVFYTPDEYKCARPWLEDRFCACAPGVWVPPLSSCVAVLPGWQVACPPCCHCR